MTLTNDMQKGAQAGRNQPAVLSHMCTLESRHVAHAREMRRDALSPQLSFLT